MRKGNTSPSEGFQKVATGGKNRQDFIFTGRTLAASEAGSGDTAVFLLRLSQWGDYLKIIQTLIHFIEEG